MTLASAMPGLGNLELEANWQLAGDRYCVSGEDVKVHTPLGPMVLRQANLCMTLNPVSLEGEATTTMPALGFLEKAGVTSEGRRARVSLALGSQLGTIDVGGRSMETEANHYYFRFEYNDGLDIGIGNATMSSPGNQAVMIWAPQEPLLYLSGAMAAPFLPQDIKEAAFGFSPQGRLPFRPARPLRDNNGAVNGDVSGHLLVKGSVPLTAYPVTISGEVVWDVDADGDGVSVFGGALRDFRMAANAGVAVGYSKAGFDFTFDVATGSLLYDARPGPAGHLYLSSGDTGGLFNDTPLAVFQPEGPQGDLWAYFRSLDDFALQTTMSSRVGGFAMQKTQVTLDGAGIRATGSLTLPARIGAVAVSGALSATAGLDLRGRANLVLGGFKMVNADVRLGGSGVGVAGMLELPGLGAASLSGSIQPQGSFDLAGSGDLAPAGLKLANASVRLGPKGASISSSVTMLGTGFKVTGKAQPNGKFSLGGRVAVNALLVRGHAELTIHERGFRTAFTGKVCVAKKACKTVAGFDLDTKGRVCMKFPLPAKKACVKVLK